MFHLTDQIVRMYLGKSIASNNSLDRLTELVSLNSISMTSTARGFASGINIDYGNVY
jgi:hypothetical protein